MGHETRSLTCRSLWLLWGPCLQVGEPTEIRVQEGGDGDCAQTWEVFEQGAPLRRGPGRPGRGFVKGECKNVEI